MAINPKFNQALNVRTTGTEIRAKTLSYRSSLNYSVTFTKVCIVKAMVFPAVMYGYESWTMRKAEC